LLRYYKDRDVWLVQPDVAQGKLTRYPRPLHFDVALNAGQ